MVSVNYYIIYSQATSFGVLLHQLDVSNELTYKVISDVLLEVSEHFPDEYIHIGGDEVLLHLNNFVKHSKVLREVWESDPNVYNFSVKNNLNFDFNDLQLYFERKVLKIVEKVGKKSVAWHDVLYNRYNISKHEIITHTW